MHTRRVEIYKDTSGGGEMQFHATAAYCAMNGELLPFQDVDPEVEHAIERQLYEGEQKGVVHTPTGIIYEWDLI